MNRRFFVLAALALGGCATVAPSVAPGPQTFGELEAVYAVLAGPQGIGIRVASRGCTTKADFAFYVERRGETAALAFGRRHVEVCKPLAPGETEITFTWEELGLSPGTPVFLLNPVTVWNGPRMYWGGDKAGG